MGLAVIVSLSLVKYTFNEITHYGIVLSKYKTYLGCAHDIL